MVKPDDPIRDIMRRTIARIASAVLWGRKAAQPIVRDLARGDGAYRPRRATMPMRIVTASATMFVSFHSL